MATLSRELPTSGKPEWETEGIRSKSLMENGACRGSAGHDRNGDAWQARANPGLLRLRPCGGAPLRGFPLHPRRRRCRSKDGTTPPEKSVANHRWREASQCPAPIVPVGPGPGTGSPTPMRSRRGTRAFSRKPRSTPATAAPPSRGFCRHIDVHRGGATRRTGSKRDSPHDEWGRP